MKKIKKGDWLLVKAREPMPETMREALRVPCRVEEVDGSFILFDNGWSVNYETGDKLLGHIST